VIGFGSKQQTANSKQQTANSKQQTANSKFKWKIGLYKAFFELCLPYHRLFMIINAKFASLNKKV
jgi:hypothetical protein